jgi:UDP-glucose:(heptosyl)LPS alpha-1,3-glucosyltransferase
MKLAIIRRNYSDFGGAEIFINRLIEQLKLDDVSIISNNWPTTDSNKKFIQAQQSGFSRKTNLIHFNQSVANIIKSYNFDVIQSHERMCGIDIFRAGDGVHASWIDKFSTESGFAKKLFLRHDPYHNEVMRLEKLMARDERIKFVANSLMTKNDLINYLNVPQERIFMIKNGFDSSKISRPTTAQKFQAKIDLGINPELPFVLFVGSGYQRKGAFLLAKAAELLPNIQIGIIGKDKKFHQLKSDVQANNLQNRVFLFGPQKNIAIYYKAADIFCLPSLYDSFSNAVLEALAFGIPCILTTNVGMHDAVSTFFAGISCQRNPDSIAHSIELALKSQRQLSDNALFLSQKYSNETPLKDWANLYQLVMSTK